MIRLRQQPETQPYLPQPTTTAWIRTSVKGTERYRLEVIEEASAIDMNAGRRNRELVPETGFAYAKLSLLESGAVLASFPLLGKMPGVIQSDPYTVWFVLDAPALVPDGIFGREIEIAAGRHLMTSSLGSWVVFFKPTAKKI
jgi:hypothetical protein